MRYVVIPQWQGSASDRAMCLADGAEAIAADLPGSATTRVPVPLEAGDAEGTGILRHSSLRLAREAYARALEGDDEPVVTIGGDGSVSYPAIVRAASLAAPPAVVWLDAHADALATSETAAFSGMTVRCLIEDGVIPADRLVLAGTRAWEDAEREWVTGAGVRTVPADKLAEQLAAVVAETRAETVYIHVGLDVLDPAVLAAVPSAVPFGLELDPLLAALRAVLARHDFAGATVAGFAPRSSDDAAEHMPTVLRILAALRPPAASSAA